ncbi:unnamed protein product [Adineta steineri]|uniref:PDZ domain-containing protein n=2 Tax=Adineta steineri TaxID=433720 RepID=A0A815EH72_9BILA|nr:unnamed protein product [Adineta steineri]CAF1310376.1 unnamed protein product [Adineta steineri]CAF1543784.1 unnamed protein product [Adineta steineri]CAF1580053.1 unnamed protein product [Adineta steineri]
MYNQQRSHISDILFEDQVLLSDGRSKPYLVLLRLTSESLIIRPLNTSQNLSSNNKDIQAIVPRNVTIVRHAITRSFGFWIKGGSDTGFPILISRVLHNNTHLLNIGDAILNINNEDISNLTHDQVINRLHDASGDQVHLTVKYMNDMATYLHLTAEKHRSSSVQATSNDLTLPRRYLTNEIHDQKRMSAEYSSENTKDKRWSLLASDQQKNNDNSNINMQEYSLLYAYVSQYLNGTDKLRVNSFQLYTLNGSQTGIIITNTCLQQNMWISRINMVIRNLTTRILAELNQTLLSSEQIFYTTWLNERIINLNDNLLPQWKSIFIVFKGNDLYIFDDNKSPPLCTYDFICCTRVYPITEIFLEIVSSKDHIDNRRYCFTLTLPNDIQIDCRYLNFERKTEYDDFILNYQRSLYISVYSLQNRTFGCTFNGQICRLIIDINKGFEMYNNETNIMLWTFTFEQLQSSSDNGRDQIYFQFKRYLSSNETNTIIHIDVQCQHLKILIHVINAFLTVKYIGQKDDNNITD